MTTLLQKFLAHGELEYTHKKLGLERVRQTLELLGHPERAYPAVLIAGTNGKGSVGRMLESVLLRAGHRAGLYSSPHLHRFNERIRVGGEEVLDRDLEAVLQDFYAKNILNDQGCMHTPSGEELTWFEKTTLLAFELFCRRHVGLALLEVGLGARLDATNVVDPLLSVITSVSLDHTEVLGDSVFDIAKEKLAVARAGKPLVIGPMEEKVRAFLSKAARIAGTQPLLPPRPHGTPENFSYGPFHGLHLGLAGRHQLSNAATALETLILLKEAGFALDNSHIREGLAQVKFPGRLEQWPGKPGVLLDGAHNPESLQGLADYLKEQFAGKDLSLILGMMKEKNPGEALKIFAPLKPRYYFTQVNSPRSLSLEEWKRVCSMEKMTGSYHVLPAEALARAQADTDPGGVVVVSGSLYLVGELRRILLEKRSHPND